MTARPPDRWIPRTSREKLVLVETVLAPVIPVFAATRERIVELMPGHSGRPAGNGDPPGGSGGGGPSVVERVVLGAGDARPTVSAEARALEQLDELSRLTVSRVEALARAAGCRLPAVPDLGVVRQLVWARWVVRLLIELDPRVAQRPLDRLWFDVELLEHVCIAWGPPRLVELGRSAELAADATDSWCRSHLRVGARAPRSDRYPVDGLCRSCGDFLAEHGWLPTLEILDALQSGMHGSTIAKMIRDEQERRAAAVRPSKKRRRRRR